MESNEQRRALLDVEAAAEYLTVSSHYLRRLVRERRVPVVRLRRHVRFDPADLDEFIARGRREARQ